MDKVFIQREKLEQMSFPLGTILSRKAVHGDVGIEIEVEGNKFEKNNLPKGWKYVSDGSLRGQDNAEYVLTVPIKFDEVDDRLKDLWKMFSDFGSVLDDSNRTSVHVHLNFTALYLNRLAAFLGIYFAVEEVLAEWCGDHRVGNLFCLRGVDAPAIITEAKRFIQSDGKRQLGENLHYAGLNMQALAKFGSIEVRTMRGSQDWQTVSTWVKILRRIYDYSAEFSDPRLVCESFSSIGPLGFFDQLLGDYAADVRNGIVLDNSEIADAMYRGLRLAQDICYCRDWELLKEKNILPDPFGRSSKKIVAAMMAAQPSQGAQLGTVWADFAPVTAATIPVGWMPDPTNEMPEPEYWDDED